MGDLMFNSRLQLGAHGSSRRGMYCGSLRGVIAVLFVLSFFLILLFISFFALCLMLPLPCLFSSTLLFMALIFA